nr:unnamed protein product [Callosobruchus analis]
MSVFQSLPILEMNI